MRKKRQRTNPTVAAYEAHAERFEKRESQAAGRTPVFLTRTLATLASPAHVLDLGCGSGHDALIFLRAEHTVLGVDATPSFVDRARVRAGRFPQRARFTVADMRTYTPPHARFDLIWANASLIHVPKRALPGVLGRLHAALKPGGRLVATLHNGRREGVHPGTWIPGRFFASYVKSELFHYVKSAGFRIEALDGVVNEDRKGRWLNLSARKG